MKFQYTVASDGKGGPLLDSRCKWVKRPIIRLELKDKDGNHFEAPAVIDSGADTTTLNIQYADLLGIALDKKNPHKIMGVGSGEVEVFQGVFPFVIKDMGIKLEVPAWYVDSNHVNILLGQEVFFDSFRIKFEKDHDTFEVSPCKS